MSKNNPESAVSKSAKKRKNIEQQMNSKKRKNMHLLSEISDQSSIKQITVTDKTQKQQNKNKYSLNISRKTKGSATKKGSLKTYKQSSLPTSKLIKSANKLKRMNEIQQLDQINNVQSIHKKSKLKAVKQTEKIKKKIYFYDERKNFEIIKAKSLRGKENDNYLNYIEYHKNTLNKDTKITCFEDDSNPVEDSLKLFQWIIQPLEKDKFFM